MDFGASNIVWDSKRKGISGVIDFGETEMGDSAYDFAGLLASYGRLFVERCLSLYKSTFVLQESLHGFENNDIEAFENVIKEYR